MSEQWEARGPDDFGDFTISAHGEQLAKCVVVQNGFRSPEETKSIAERLIKAVNSHDALVKALERMLRFCDEATLYEMQHSADYSPYLDAKALLDAVGSPKVEKANGDI
jgi:hypothetical protein